jgi:tetratricopeptide (TPR) repeat protein
MALLALLVPSAFGQTKSTEGSASIEGTVRNSQNHPLADVTISGQNRGTGQTFLAHSDVNGYFHFAALPEGTYVLHAKMPGYREASKAPLVLAQNEATTVALLLESDPAASAPNSGTHPVEFSDEPEFTVAGLTDPTNLGGHGSDLVVRTKESLAKDTVSLKPGAPDRLPPADDNVSYARALAYYKNGDTLHADQTVRTMLSREDRAELHALLGDIAEREGHPIEAVREYQRAAEMQSSEANLFAWGAELLLHRAPEPAAEVFAKGHRLFPTSARILVGLAVSSYSRGAYEEASEELLQACDVNPADPSPYLFLGKMQNAEKVEPPGWTERLKRFVMLQPENPLANYYYAVGLTKESNKKENLDMAESLLQKTIRLDAHFGGAYLHLGILYSERKGFPKAIAAYQKAIETTPLPDEAHFRLAEAYRQTGETRKARQEIEIYDQVSRQKAKEADRERHEIQQFVYTLRDRTATAPPPASTP